MTKTFDKDASKQKILYWGGISGFIIFIIVIIYVFVGEEISTAPKPRELKMVTPGSLIDKRDVWMSQIENENKIQDKEIDFLKGIVLGDAKKTGDKNDSQIEVLKKEIESLKQQIQQNHLKIESNTSSNSLNPLPIINNPEKLSNNGKEGSYHPQTQVQNSENYPINPYENPGNYTQNNQINRINKPNIEIGKFVISNDFTKKPKKNYKDFIPSGSFFKAVLIGGVSAKCGVNETANPQPIPIRILDNGSLPNNFTSHLKRCRLIGAASGDISTERVFIRAERLSCIDNKTGNVTELTVDGHITGPDGINGIAGFVEDRSGAMTSRAAISGLLNGISGAFAANAQNNNMASQVSAMKNIAGDKGAGINFNMDTLKSSASNGAGDALKMLSEYWIKRAEQLQPVIKVEPGTKVNIVVTRGIAFNEVSKRSGTAGNNRNTNNNNQN